jgi:ribosome recycling factor
MEQIVSQTEKNLKDVLGLVVDDLKAVKTGRAKPSLVEDIKVQAYNSIMTLKELASISAPDVYSIVINPWDKSILKDIEKALGASGLNLNAVCEGDVLRVKIPPLTEETRKDLVKLVYQKLESGRRMIRQVRNDAKSQIEASKGEAGVSEDDIKNQVDKLQELVDKYQEQLEALGKAKEEELMTV